MAPSYITLTEKASKCGCQVGQIPQGDSCVSGQATCTDSDGGISYGVKGTTVRGSETMIDNCYNGQTFGASTGYAVTEYYCLDDKIASTTTNCADLATGYVCENGACIDKTEPPVPRSICSDTDGGPNDYATKGKVTSGKVSATDSCASSTILTEYGCHRQGIFVPRSIDCQANNQVCLDGACVNSQATCTDSDGGKNYLVKGYVRTPSISGSDFCLGNDLLEYSCVGGNSQSEQVSCEKQFGTGSTCKDGACSGNSAQVSEIVRCVFNGNAPGTEQNCYSEKGSCQGTQTAGGSGSSYCDVKVSGWNGQQVEWKSSCGGYQYSRMDGETEKVMFDCNQTCDDGTPVGKCSTKQPYHCGLACPAILHTGNEEPSCYPVLTELPSACGCPAGFTPNDNNDKCVPANEKPQTRVISGPHLFSGSFEAQELGEALQLPPGESPKYYPYAMFTVPTNNLAANRVEFEAGKPAIVLRNANICTRKAGAGLPFLLKRDTSKSGGWYILGINNYPDTGCTNGVLKSLTGYDQDTTAEKTVAYAGETLYWALRFVNPADVNLAKPVLNSNAVYYVEKSTGISTPEVECVPAPCGGDKCVLYRKGDPIPFCAADSYPPLLSPFSCKLDNGNCLKVPLEPPIVTTTPLPTGAPVCVETGDTGLQYTARGTVTITDPSGAQPYTDYCVTPDTLQEYACAGDGLGADRVNCAQRVGAGSVCQNGACVPRQPNVFEQLIGGIISLLSGGQGSQNPAVTVSTPTPSAPQAPTCIDSDGGIAYGVRGTASGTEGTALAPYSLQDWCLDSSTLRELFCVGNQMSANNVNCVELAGAGSVCQNGACTAASIPIPGAASPTCVDSDGGMNLDVRGTTTTTGSEWGAGGTDYCQSATSLVEYSCSIYGHSVPSGETCPSGQVCQDGACTATPVTPTPIRTCADSDGGRAYNVVGTATEGNERCTDSCSGPATLTECYCTTDNTVATESVSCLTSPAGTTNYVCQTGKCVQTGGVPLQPNGLERLLGNFIKGLSG